MRVLLAVAIGALYAAGFYMMMRRGIVKIGLGLALLSNAANLLIFVAAGPSRAAAAIIPTGQTVPSGPVADPLPQALILTAIVIALISFLGTVAFGLYVEKRASE